ncbi:MAG: outer membrane beta-barrel protein [Verrucomicrobiota bacterium]
MKFDKWTIGLAAAGVVSMGVVAVADESPVSTLVSGTTLNGYVDTSAIYKPGVQSAAYRFVNTAPDTWNGFNFNVVDLAIEKALDEGQWSAGYKADLWFGPQASGIPGSLGGNNFGVRAAYVALRAPVGNGLDFKVGQLYGVTGYESADSPYNPNFSRSLGFRLEPINYTGITTTYQVADWIKVTGGIADSAYDGTNVKQTYDGTFSDGKFTSNGGAGNGTLTYVGAITLTAPESMGVISGATLTGGIVDNGISNGKNAMIYYVGTTVPTPIKEVTVGAAWDYNNNGGGNGTWATAIAGYVSWQVSEKMKLNGRVEFAKSNVNAWDIGPTVEKYNSDINDYDSVLLNSGATRLFATTLTLDYALWANVITRLEVVWDHDLNGSGIFSSQYTVDEIDEVGSRAAAGIPGYSVVNGRNNSVLLAANIIYKF